MIGTENVQEQEIGHEIDLEIGREIGPGTGIVTVIVRGIDQDIVIETREGRGNVLPQLIDIDIGMRGVNGKKEIENQVRLATKKKEKLEVYIVGGNLD